MRPAQNAAVASVGVGNDDELRELAVADAVSSSEGLQQHNGGGAGSRSQQ